MKIKLNNKSLLLLIDLITEFVAFGKSKQMCNDADMCALLDSSLEELLLKLNRVALIRQTAYTIKMKASWGFALRVAFAGRYDFKNETGKATMLMMLCDGIHKVLGNCKQ